jgi:hypothetical protein
VLRPPAAVADQHIGLQRDQLHCQLSHSLDVGVTEAQINS